MNLKRVAGYFLASSKLARTMETARYVVVEAESLLKKAKDANTRYKNNEKRKKRERAKVNCERRRQFKVKKERVERLEKQVLHFRLEKVLDGVDSGEMTGKRRRKTNSPDSESKSKLESLIAYQQNLNNELQLKIEFVRSLANNASDLNLFKDRLLEKFELVRLRKENAKLQHLNNSLREQKCTLKGHGLCTDSTLGNLAASNLVSVADKKKVRAVTGGEKERLAIKLKNIPDPAETKTEGIDEEVNENVDSMTEIVPNNEKTRVVCTKVSSKEGARNSCNKCGKSYPRKDSLKRHMRVHSPESPVKCNICDKTCVRKDTLKRHLRGHSMGASLECDVCKRKFKRKDALQQHKKQTPRAGRCIPLKKSVKEEIIESRENFIRKVALEL